jgi:hypothetical protein
MKEKLTKEDIMKKSFAAILLTLIITPVIIVLLLTALPMTLTGCFFNPYHAWFDSEVQKYIDFDYIESLESFGNCSEGEIYVIEDESVLKKALPRYDISVDFDKQIAILHIYNSSEFEYYVNSIRLIDGVLSVDVFYTQIYLPWKDYGIQPAPRCFLLTMDKLSFDSVEFIDFRSGGHPR